MRGYILPLAIGGTMAAASTAALAAGEWKPVERDPSVKEVPFDSDLFKADPEYDITYDPEAQIEIYGGKKPVDNPKPPVEIGRGLYDPGEIGDGIPFFGDKNRLFPAFSVFGDLRSAVAFNDNGDDEVAIIAAAANLNFNLELTGTERIHMFWQPVDDVTGFEFAGDDRSDGVANLQEEPTTLFFEGDLGAIWTGISDEYTSWDMPIAFGRVPLLFQNGVWFNDAFLGAAVTIPAQNSPALDITNFDITFFAGWDEITSNAFTDNNGNAADHEADMYGVAGFFDVAEGYLEVGYAYLLDTDKQSGGDQSYHNITAAFSKRYFGKIANATRIIGNFGQDKGANGQRTANGFLLISENAFITPSITLIPHANFFIGKDTPQKVAGNNNLQQVGLNFETDALTGFPKLNDTGADAIGGAVGIQYLFGLEQQVVAEIAGQVPWDDKEGIQEAEMGFQIRYQRPLNNRLIFRADAMYGLRFGGLNDLSGARVELRVKL
ncbi:MAG: hypothetical protein AAFV19_00050 [Pseudomonadota bacterium]